LVDTRVDDVENALAGLAGGDGFHDIIRAEHLAGDEGREGRSDLGLTLMEDALEGEGADLLRLLRLEDEAKGNPIRDISIEEAEDGKDPPLGIDDPDEHLDDTEEEAEVESRADDELELVIADIEEHPAHQLS